MGIFSDAWDDYSYYWGQGWKELTGGDPSTSVGQSLNSAGNVLSTTVNETATIVSSGAEKIFDIVTTPIKAVYDDAKSAVGGANQTVQLIIVGGVVVVALVLLTRSGRTMIASAARTQAKAAGAAAKIAAKVI